jgi:hypothetical protein
MGPHIIWGVFVLGGGGGGGGGDVAGLYPAPIFCFTLF